MEVNGKIRLTNDKEIHKMKQQFNVLIGENGEQLGIMSAREAMKLRPAALPPSCVKRTEKKLCSDCKARATMPCC